MTVKRLLLTVVLASSVLAPAAARACDGQCSQAVKPGELRELSATELAKLLETKKATPVDANGQETRERQGVIPGAVLLTSTSQYALEELPKDKAGALVFYCANQRCNASHAAARRAVEAGYTDVAALPTGITGWKQAGLPTSRPTS
jgi:rhodanese-related sulfurtransferase